MALHEGEEAVFCSASAYFPEEQWMLLKEWQKELYGNVMKEIHRALMSLGPLIATTVYMLRDQEKQDVSTVGQQRYERRGGINEKAGDMMANSYELPGLKREGVSHVTDPGDAGGTERTEYVSTGHPSVSCCVKDEEAAYSVYHPEIPSMEICSTPTMFTPVKPEQDTHFQQVPSSEGKTAGGEGRKKKDIYGHLSKDPEKTTAVKVLPEHTKNVRSPENLVNRERQMWEGNILVLGEEETIDQELVELHPEHFNLQQVTSHTQISDTRMDSGSHVWNSHPPPYHTSAQISPRPFACTECKNLFRSEVELTRHQRTHLGPRPFRCTICEMSFIQNQHLIQHQRSHTGEKPYQCPRCKKRFSLKGNLNKHQRKQMSRCTSPLVAWSPVSSDMKPEMTQKS